MMWMKIKGVIKIIVVLMILGGSGFLTIRYWSFLFAKTVEGVVTNVQRAGPSTAILDTDNLSNRRSNNKDLFSFAVGIVDKEGNIHTASTEDRQWAVVKPGQCAKAKLFPYPPWELGKGGTFFNARLLQLRDCPEGAQYLKSHAPDQKELPPES